MVEDCLVVASTDVAVSVTYFVTVEVGRRMLPACFHSVSDVRCRASVAVVGMEMIVYVAIKPRTRPNVL